jgi:L,D-peptidoglycan transpeptidase YkuD (ErfK/YbiS/YcfS/YnhG family)
MPPVFTGPVPSMALSNIISVSPPGSLKWHGHTYRCAVGLGGIVATKREGDHASPLGCFPLRKILYRSDRIGAPQSDLPVSALSPSDGWCDAPRDDGYNQPVLLPYAASAETLWRDDNIYDLVVVLGHNDSPVVPGCGSAIFLHVAHADYSPTQGCVAMARDDLLEVLNDCDQQTQICIMA